MPSGLEELVEFLHSPQPAIVQTALDNLVGYSQGPHRKVFEYNNYDPIKDLKRLSLASSKMIVNQSVTILANLCDRAAVRVLILEDREYMKHFIGAIIRPTNTNSDRMTILLSNLAKSDSIASVFDADIEVELEDNERNIFRSSNVMDCLMDCFVKGFDRSFNQYANYDYLAYFFSDVSRLERGRKYFNSRQDYDGVVPISKLLVFTEKYDSKIRREGVASTIKNSLFDIKSHEMLIMNEDINLLPYILLPLAGSEELNEDEMFDLPDELQLLPPDKIREPIETIFITHLESLLLLNSSKAMREHLRSKSVYPLIREIHKQSDSEDVTNVCDRLVQLLMRDEGNDIFPVDESDEERNEITEIV